VGKSSLVRAGLVPAIERGWLGEDERRKTRSWKVLEPIRPGTDPIENLATVLGNAFGRDIRQLYTELRDPADHEARALRLRLRDHALVTAQEALVLIVDQFEELFTPTEDVATRARFDALLAAALTDLDGPLHLVTTVRSDFRPRIAELPRLRALLDAAGSYLLPPVDENGLRDVVRSPARIAGLDWSDPELPEEIVQEAIKEPAGLPLVGNLLRLLWEESEPAPTTQQEEERDQGSRGPVRRAAHPSVPRDRSASAHPPDDGQVLSRRVLSRRVYRELGGLGGALANRPAPAPAPREDAPASHRPAPGHSRPGTLAHSSYAAAFRNAAPSAPQRRRRGPS
jgi:hypothetical protein